MKDVGVTNEKMGFRPQKHDFSVLRVKYPLFNLKGPFFFSSDSKFDNESIQKQNSVCPF